MKNHFSLIYEKSNIFKAYFSIVTNLSDFFLLFASLTN